MRIALSVVAALVAGSSVVAAQSPTHWDTLAKWPWSISLQSGPFREHTVQLKLAPKEGMEFKYRLDLGGGMLYSWTATSELYWELHSQPDNGPRGYADFFDINQGTGSHGMYHAPFTGIHGWWWENRSDREVTITLTTAGFYNETHEFRKGVPVKITPLP
jgi:hypothetical protein